MKHTLSILVENKFGVLARVAGLFSARGYNIDSLTVSETEDSSVSRMTVVVDAEDERILEQIKKQLHKLIDVITIVDFAKGEFIERELIFVKVDIAKKNQDKLNDLIEETKACVLEKKDTYMVIEVMGDQEQLRNFLEKLEGFGVLELVRSGRTAIAK